jgi:hypothetical protein
VEHRFDAVFRLRIDQRYCVFDWPEMIWRLRVYGYLARTRNGIKRLRTDAINNELCCDEETEISSYVSWLIDGEMRSPLDRKPAGCERMDTAIGRDHLEIVNASGWRLHSANQSDLDPKPEPPT